MKAYGPMRLISRRHGTFVRYLYVNNTANRDTSGAETSGIPSLFNMSCMSKSIYSHTGRSRVMYQSHPHFEVSFCKHGCPRRASLAYVAP
ncbi:hypothetical protein FH972_025101 [Carpinus fangiana]|uniref:Uncharacterized protein n=1 Tax=Carpinus fangiana TaxID=176857 RepID=A0A5N6L0K8_9ROSI|nr:hypothetical protein FH972_025101 [Carpinus fangiana]